MNVVRFNFTCAVCSHRFQTNETPEESYGLFVMRTSSGEEIGLDSFKDVVFDELENMVKVHPLFPSMTPKLYADVLQDMFTVTCDRNALNESYHINLMPRCPACGSHEMRSWGEVSPAIWSTIAEVTHSKWNNMASEIKRKTVHDEILKRLG